MKQQMKRLAVLLGMLSLVALAGCGGGGSSSSTTTTTPTTPTTTSVSGVVADGYLVGAKVCLDKNGNKTCDAGEPSATTTGGGSYTLSDVSSADVAAYPILVEVTTAATDEQRGAVTKGYVLTAPAGKTDFISPLTTLVQNQVETTGVSVDAAEATVRNSLGLNTSLFSNFNPGGATATPEQKLAASVAKVIATTIANNKAAIETAVGASNTSVDAVVKLVVQQVMQQLPTVLQQVQGNLVNGTLPESAVSGVVSSSGLTISTSNTATLGQQLAAAGAIATATDLAAFFANGGYGFDRYQSGYNSQTQTAVYSVSYHKVLYTSSTGGISFADYDLSNNSWQVDSSSSELYLTSTGWQSEVSGGTYNQSTGIYTSGVGIQEKPSVVKYDVSNKPISSYLASSYQGSPLPSGSFPAGSEAVRMTFVYLADTYRLSSGWQICTQADQVGNCTAYATTLTGMISSNSYPNGGWTGSDQLAYQFGALNSSTNSGKLYLYLQSSLQQQQTPQPIESTYQIKTVNGVQMLVADGRPAGGGYNIFVAYNGKVHGGNYYPANVAQLSSGYNFNKTAINAIFTAAMWPTI